MTTLAPLPDDPTTRVTRLAHRQVFDRQVLHDVLDAGLVAHVGVVRDDVAVVLPLAYARDGDALLLHGSSGGGLLRAAAAGAPVTVTVTLLDGLVYARSAFDSSMNYRCASVTGTCEVVTDPEEKDAGLRRLTDHLMPGRSAEVRASTRRELAATLLLRLPLQRASVKLRAEQAGTAPDDGEDRAVWAGVLPLRTGAGEPVATRDTPAGVPVPRSVTAAVEQLAGAGPDVAALGARGAGAEELSAGGVPAR
ncbi:pyridoxamine 5'-phosphate oxidase family protein [Kineococcus gynurae]|uniref:Pyridoxamine 5'-phosphate oxidase family protein n=1 Tax=Kineococcus gynurae TaxID=452979 RepID=A0ABV5LUZ0_9ACTN